MKKCFYLLPFIIMPLLLLCCEWLDNSGVLRMSPLILALLLLALGAALGYASPAASRCDVKLALLCAMALFCVMFAAGFADATEVYRRFDPAHGWLVAMQPLLLPIYAVPAAGALLGSSLRA